MNLLSAKTPLSIAAAMAGLVAGFCTSRALKPANVAAPSQESAPLTTSQIGRSQLGTLVALFADKTYEAARLRARKLESLDASAARTLTLAAMVRPRPWRNEDHEMLAALLGRWSELATEEVAREAATRTDFADHMSAWVGVWCAIRDPTDATKWAAELPERLREPFWKSFSQNVGGRHPREGIEVIETLPTQNRGRWLANVIQDWAGAAPGEAAAFVQKWPNAGERERALERLAEVWGSHDPQAALDWLQTLPEADIGNLRGTVLAKLAEKDPARALALAADDPTPWVRNSVAFHAAGSFPHFDLEEGVRSFASRSESVGGISNEEVFFDSALRCDPARAVAEVAKLSPGDARDRLAVKMARAMTAQAPYLGANVLDQAAGLIENVTPESKDIESVAKVLAAADPARADAWAAKLPEAARESARRAMREYLGEESEASR